MVNEGWRCPGCGSCYAPWVAKCDQCSPEPITNVTITTGEQSWPLCVVHGRMYPPSESCPVCTGKLTA